jgi:hypothetical protein
MKSIEFLIAHCRSKRINLYMTFKLENGNADSNSSIKARMYRSHVASVLLHIENDTVVIDNLLVSHCQFIQFDVYEFLLTLDRQHCVMLNLNLPINSLSGCRLGSSGSGNDSVAASYSSEPSAPPPPLKARNSSLS